MQYPRHTRPRLELLRITKQNLEAIVSRQISAQTAARWFTQQFEVATEIENEDTTDHAPFQFLEEIM